MAYANEEKVHRAPTTGFVASCTRARPNVWDFGFVQMSPNGQGAVSDLPEC